MTLLRRWRWPGNIRELKNLVQRLLILGGEEEITLCLVIGRVNAILEAIDVSRRTVEDGQRTKEIVEHDHQVFLVLSKLLN